MRKREHQVGQLVVTLGHLMAIAIILVSFIACSPVRYGSWRPPGSTEPAWAIKAEKSIGGFVTVTIDGNDVVHGQLPLFGSREFQGEYRGRKITMALTNELGHTQEGQGQKCIVMIDGEVATQVSW